MTVRAAAPLDAEAALPFVLLLQHLKEPEEEEALVDASRYGALAWIEHHVGRSLTRRGWVASWTSLDAGCRSLRLPMGPVHDVTAVTYRDSAGAAVTWPVDAYRVDGDELATNSRLGWSSAFAGLSFSVAYDAGYDDLGREAPALRSAALLLAGHLFRNREENAAVALASVPFGVTMLCEPFRSPVMG